MKKIAVSVIVLVFLVGIGVCCADSSIPNLVGTWTIQSEGAVITRGSAPGLKTHPTGEFSVLTAEVIVTKQQGRVLHGTFTSPKATEKFIAVIGTDNKTLYFADEDGFLEGKIVSNDKIEHIYRHVTPVDTVVAVGTWTRKK